MTIASSCKTMELPPPPPPHPPLLTVNRLISLLPALSKVAERMASSQYTTYLIENKRFSNHQNGNKRHHSTSFRTTDEKKVTAMVLLDLSKAFDSVCHERQLQKLEMVGTSTPAFMWFRSYLSDRYQVTRFGRSTSPPLLVKRGVPQGSILRPLLFTIYLNDLPNAVSSI